MELEKVTAEIRPRSEWEAVDLGLSLARSHLGTLWKAWLVTVIPLSILILLAFHQSLGWGAFLIWWLKPIWDRVALFPLSRNLFGEKPNTRATIMVVPTQLKENWLLVALGIVFSVLGLFIHQGDSDGLLIFFYWMSLLGVLFYRSSIYRSVVLPVRFLEGLQGTQYRSRVNLLTRRSSGAAFALTVLCLLMEVGLFMSIFYFAELMVPAGVQWSFWGVFKDLFTVGSDAFPKWLMIGVGMAYVVAMSIASWFYSGGGFGLYVNSRTLTEGWDIELSFKRLGQRLGLILMFFAAFSVNPEVRAETTQERMEQVLSNEDFEVQTRTERSRVDDDDDERSSSSDGVNMSGGAGVFAGVGQIIFWVVAIAAVVGIVWLIVQNLQAFRGRDAEVVADRKKVKTLAGMSIAPETLPEDILAAAQKLWSEGHRRESLALLYRGAISSLVTRDLVEIEESDTELDCLTRLRSSSLAESGYFENLTYSWMAIAYADQTPDEMVMQRLWSEWPFAERGSR